MSTCGALTKMGTECLKKVKRGHRCSIHKKKAKAKALLKPLKFSSEQINKYTKKDCNMLAHAINHLTGWTIYVLSRKEKDEWRWVHMFCRTPNGLVIDIEGIRDYDSFIKEWTLLNSDGKSKSPKYCKYFVLPYDKYITIFEMNDSFNSCSKGEFNKALSVARRLINYYVRSSRYQSIHL